MCEGTNRERLLVVGNDTTIIGRQLNGSFWRGTVWCRWYCWPNNNQQRGGSKITIQQSTMMAATLSGSCLAVMRSI